MENHRLKPMPQNYDVKVFNEIYQQTQNLRIKLSREIDHRRFGLTQDEIVSWFDDKFIFAFTKYYNTHNTEVLKGHIIRALQFFKCRVLRAAYTEKYKNKLINIDDVTVFANSMIELPSEVTESYSQKLFEYLSTIISDNAVMVLKIKLNPPPYILSRSLDGNSNNCKVSKIKVTDSQILEYFGIPENKKSLRWLLNLNNEIQQGIEKAKKHFIAS